MNQLSEYEINMLQKFGQSVIDGKWSNSGLVQFIEVVSSFLNLETIPNYAKKHKLSYNGVKKTREIIVINSVKYVIDNK